MFIGHSGHFDTSTDRHKSPPRELGVAKQSCGLETVAVVVGFNQGTLQAVILNPTAFVYCMCVTRTALGG